MVTLTVGYVSGFVALAIAVFSFMLPNLIALLMASLVGRERSAVTWSVLGRQLHKSFWATLLNSDSTSSKTPKPVWLLGWLEIIGIALVTVAGVVTPLGLRSEVRLASSPQPVSFQYMADSGPMGYGTPARDPRGFLSRICTEEFHLGGCPFSDTVVQTSYNASGSLTSWNGSYDVRLPYVTANVFSSVHDEHPTTISGALEMEWRQYAYSQRPDFNNEAPFQVGMTRSLASLILDNTVQAVEGLVVDTAAGGVALRNHTAPTNLDFGAEWEEDLLFLTPDSVCVDTNLTLDFEIAQIGAFANYSASNVVNVSLTDRGGFINLNKTYPQRPQYDGQADPDLWFRAYKAAWWSNALNMFFLNVTNPRDAQHAHAFQYLNSSMNKRFWLDSKDVPTANTDKLSLSGSYSLFSGIMGYYNSINGTYVPFDNSSRSPYFYDPRAYYPNPFNISGSNYSDAGLFCSGAGGQDYANISNLAVSCGLIYGAATRQDGRQNLVLESGTAWTQKLYSCATAIKAEIKQVRFQWNSTATGSSNLQRLKILSINPKNYTSNGPQQQQQQQQQQPWWAVENLQRPLGDMSPLWGPVSSAMAKEYANDSNFDFVQSPRLYVPGYALGQTGISPETILQDNTAASSAIIAALGAAYNIDSSSQYSGMSSMAILSKWQRLSSSPESAAQIPGLIWTDNIANLILGSRSWLSARRMPSNVQPPNSQISGSSNNNRMRRQQSTTADVTDTDPVSIIPSAQVYLYQSRITYNWLYAIPAFLTLAVFALIFLMIAILLVSGQIAHLGELSDYLKRTSSGRLLLAVDEHRRRDAALQGSGSEKTNVDQGYMMSQSTRRWVKGYGQRIVNLSVTTDSAGVGFVEKLTADSNVGIAADEGGSSSSVGQPARMSGGYKAVPQVIALDRSR